MTKNKFPNGVRVALERAEMSQADFAREIGENRQQVSRWVNEERKLTLAMALKMAPVLRTTPDQLLVPPGLAEIVKKADLGDHKSASEKDREIRDAIHKRLRELSVEGLADVAAEAVAEIQARSSGSARPEKRTKRVPRSS